MFKNLQTLVIILFTTIGFSQLSVSGTFSPAEDFTYAFLYKSLPNGATYMDRGQTDEAGNFSITLGSAIVPGMYKIVYAIPPEDHNFDMIINGEENIHFTFSFEDGIKFTHSNENQLWANYVSAVQAVNKTINNFYLSENKNKSEFKSIFASLQETHEAYENNAKGLLVESFIKANKPYIPKNFEDAATYSQNLKDNFLKHVDFADELLQSSDFLKDRVNAYLFDIVEDPNVEDYKQLLTEIDNLVGDNNNHYKSILYTNIWDRFVSDKQVEMAVYITDKYLLKLAEKEQDEALIDALLGFKNTATGVKAVDFEIPLNNTTLHNLNITNNYLLMFWSSSCSHCLKELPVVNTLLEGNNQIKVIAIGLEEDLEQWETEIEKYPDFIHVVQLNKWDGDLVKAYNIKSTPTYFLLNSDKVIIEKPHDSDALKALINN